MGRTTDKSICASCKINARNGSHPSYCKDCQARIAKDNQNSSTCKRKHKLKHYYGLTLEQEALMIKNQNGVCAICEDQCYRYKRLSVDHQHGTKHIRGLLCHTCNAGLGMFKDNPELLMEASNYLLKNSLKAVE